MKKYLAIFLGVLICMVLSDFGARGQVTQEGRTPAERTPLKVDPSFGKTPLYFIPNKGQVDEKALFYAQASRYTLWLTREGLIFDGVRTLGGKDGEPGVKSPGVGTIAEAIKFERDVSRVRFLNSNEAPEIVPEDETEYTVNYFIGNDESKWKTDIRASREVAYREIYRNIDLRVYGIEKEIEYDWVVRPGGDVNGIRFEYDGVKGTRIDDGGNLVIETKFGEIMHRRPQSYQVIKGERTEVDVRFKGLGGNIYGFTAAHYREDSELVIDPVILVYSTYLGGNYADLGLDIAVDGAGSAYVTGYTVSTDFPTVNPYMSGPAAPERNVFVTKFSATGNTLLYSTYLGGNGEDTGEGIAVDSEGYAYVTGLTRSTNFPTNFPYMTDPGDGTADAFVARLSPLGNALAYSTYLGGTGSDGGRDIAIDSATCAYVTGYTLSTNFPTVNPYMADALDSDAFVAKLSAAGNTLVYSTYLGGNGEEGAYGIAVDIVGNAYVTGYSYSTDFPVEFELMADANLMDAFVTALGPSGSDLWFSTYLGGNGYYDWGLSIAVIGSLHSDPQFPSWASVYISGQTNSTDFPTKNACMTAQGGDDAFVTQLRYNPRTFYPFPPLTLIYSTYLGGNAHDVACGIAVDSLGCVYVTGETDSANFPMVNHLMSHSIGKDAFASMLSAEGNSLVYSTYLGGNSEDSGLSIAADGSGCSYLIGVTRSTNFPTANPYMADPGDNYDDAFVTKLALATSPIVTTAAVTDITQTTAASGGNVTSDGGTAVTARGVCWSTAENPTTADSKTTDGSGTGPFVSSLTALASNTTYHVRAYATNLIGTAYGDDVQFTTLAAPILAPTVTTAAVTDITQTTAQSGGNVTSDGGAAVTARGVCWSTSANPTIADSHTTEGTGTGSFVSNLTVLNPNTTYHLRAYATNSADTAYGNDLEFATLQSGGWTAGKRLTWNSGWSIYPAIAVNTSGHINMVWEDSTPGNFEIYYKKSTDGGATWTANQKLTLTSGTSQFPAIAVNSAGYLHVVWQDNTLGNDEVYYKKSTDGGATWSASRRLTWNAGYSTHPTIAVNSAGHIHLVWFDNSPGNYEIYYRKSTDGGATWSASQRLTSTSGSSEFPVIAVDSAGHIHLVWSDNSLGNYEIYYRKSTNGGATWSASKRLTWTAGISTCPAIAGYSSDYLHVVWQDNMLGNDEIYYKMSTDGGATWSANKRLTWTSGASMDPAIAVDPSDNLHVVWIDSTPGNLEIYYRKFMK